MGRRRNKNIINVSEAISFLEKVYGIESRVINEYQLRLTPPEYDGWYDWYHTSGTVVRTSKGIDNSYHQSSFTKAFTDEDVAIAINKDVHTRTQ